MGAAQRRPVAGPRRAGVCIDLSVRETGVAPEVDGAGDGVGVEAVRPSVKIGIRVEGVRPGGLLGCIVHEVAVRVGFGGGGVA